MRRLIPILSRTSPLLVKKLFFASVFVVQYTGLNLFRPVQMASKNAHVHEIANLINDNSITIEFKGDYIGTAYCFTEGYLVTTRYLLDNIANNQIY